MPALVRNMAAELTTIGLDADDTLWENEQFFRLTQDRFAALMAPYADPDHLHERLLAAERRNLGHYGFGIKGFVLSMIETALEVGGPGLPASVIRELIDAGQDMLRHPIRLLPEAEATVRDLSRDYTLVLITKGDLLDQERKLAQSGLGDYFDAVEILSEKSAAAYARIFSRHGAGAERAMMVGNSLRSDVLPALAAGSWAVHVPHAVTWALERAPRPDDHRRFRAIDRLGALRKLIETL